MKAPIEPTLTLEAVAEHFAQWRSGKKKGERIPEPLWQEAIDLLDRYSVAQVTRTLRLGGSDLNKRRGITGGGRRRKNTGVKSTNAEASFVEIARQDDVRASERNVTSTWLELHRPDGLRLCIHRSGGEELVALVDRFMGV